MILNISGVTQAYLANLDRTQQQINQAAAEVSSGLSVQQPSDNPAAVPAILQTQADIAANGIMAPIVGHVGDGNFHLTMLVDPNDADEVERAKDLNARLVERALAMDGTCTGEHGVGQGKIKYLKAEYGAAALSAMAAIKRALDPQGIMNPGKILALD